MSAPANAITLFQEAETQWMKGQSRKMLRQKVSCSCGFKGRLGDLLCDPADETINNFWCPICKTKGWVWD